MPTPIPILNNQFESTYADQWGRNFPIALERARPVLESECHVLRIFVAPDLKTAGDVTAGTYKKQTVAIAPGSFVLGLRYSSESNTAMVQITDLATNLKYFRQPYPSNLMFRSSQDWLFSTPQPVLSPGNLLVEVWAVSTGSVCMNLIVAEYDREYAKSRGCLVPAAG